MVLCGLPASDAGTCRWIEGDALDLPFTDCYFDAVTVGYGLRNVVDKLKAMREIYRVLKPGSVQVKILFKFCFVSNLDKFSELGFTGPQDQESLSLILTRVHHFSRHHYR
jgi:demethylmenaquinone methyltransferase/2-methoxy-6-polyprenyl-1,4-benzoquinol methylase